METQKVSYYNWEGTYEEIGREIAKQYEKALFPMPAPDFYTDKDVNDALALYDKYCPGIREELEGFSKEAKIPVKDIAYTWMSYLVPRCSGLITLGSHMTDGHTRLARNYEFNLGDEDLIVCRTKPKGKYAHIGGSIAVFGRCEGVNECGLAVSMSSCGFPVSNMEGMRPPAIKGLQFWAVIRSLLENCKDVEEALKLALEMPIAFNINLYLADASGVGALIETMNGEVAYEKITTSDAKHCLYGTNHIAIPSFQHLEPVGMRNSKVRFDKITEFVSSHASMTEPQIKEFLLKRYPEGMSVNYYDEYFGTIKSVVMDTVERKYSICWFGQEENGWEDYFAEQPIKEHEKEKVVVKEQGNKEFFEVIPL